jgi:hypothetical protein
VTVGEGVGLALVVPVRVARAVITVRDTVAETVVLLVCDTETVKEVVMVGVTERDTVEDTVCETVAVCVGETVIVGVIVGDPVVDLERVSETVCETVTVGVCVAEGLEDNVERTVITEPVAV